jgi:hypothetical protein
MSEPVPTPEQIRTYLGTHGWAPDDPLSDLVIFTYKQPSDDGQPITVGVPDSTEVIYYPLRVKDVVVTVAWVENRSEADVLADLLATKGVPASHNPSVPAA